MALFGRKQPGKGSGPQDGGEDRWVRLGEGCEILRLYIEDEQNAVKWNNPAFRAYTARISRAPLDFMLSARERVSSPVVHIKAGGRASLHGFHLILDASGHENLRRLSGGEGVHARHFSAELIRKAQAAAAVREKAAREGPGSLPPLSEAFPSTTAAPARKPASKPAPAPKGGGDFSDFSDFSEPAGGEPTQPSELGLAGAQVGGDLSELGPSEEEFQTFMNSGRAPGEDLPPEAGGGLAAGMDDLDEAEEISEAELVDLGEAAESAEQLAGVGQKLGGAGEFLGGGSEDVFSADEPPAPVGEQTFEAPGEDIGGAGDLSGGSVELGGAGEELGGPAEDLFGQADSFELGGPAGELGGGAEAAGSIEEPDLAPPEPELVPPEEVGGPELPPAHEPEPAGGADADEEDPFAALEEEAPAATPEAGGEDAFAALDEPAPQEAAPPPDEDEFEGAGEPEMADEALFEPKPDAPQVQPSPPQAALTVAADISLEGPAEPDQPGQEDDESPAQEEEGDAAPEETPSEALVREAEQIAQDVAGEPEPESEPEPQPEPEPERGSPSLGQTFAHDDVQYLEGMEESGEGDEASQGQGPEGSSVEAQEAGVTQAAGASAEPPEEPPSAEPPEPEEEAVGLGDEEIEDAEDFLREAQVSNGDVDDRYRSLSTDDDVQGAIAEAEELEPKGAAPVAQAEPPAETAQDAAAPSAPVAPAPSAAAASGPGPTWDAESFVDFSDDADIQQALSDAGDVVMTPVEPPEPPSGVVGGSPPAAKPPAPEPAAPEAASPEPSAAEEDEEDEEPIGLTEELPEEPDWIPFSKENSDALKLRAKESKIAERTADRLVFDLPLRAKFPDGAILSGTLCIYNKRPALLAEGEDEPRTLLRECLIAYS